MDLENRVLTLETEFKIIKGEIKALLLDMRETVNDMENPFRSPEPAIGNMGSVKGKLLEARGLPPIEKSLIKKIPAVEADSGFFEETAEPEEAEEIEEFFGEEAEIPKRQDKTQEKSQEVPRITMENDINTYTLVELMRWTDYTLSTIGKKRLEEILNLYALTGHLPEKVKDVIVNIAKLSTADVAEESQATMNDNITVIAQLHEILNPGESGQKEQKAHQNSQKDTIPKSSKISLN